MDLTQEQRLLLLSTDAADMVMPAAAVAPDRLVEEGRQLALVERNGATSAWRHSPAGISAPDAVQKCLGLAECAGCGLP